MKERGLEQVNEIISDCENILASLELMGKSPNNTKILERKYSVNEACEMIGRARVTLHRAEKEGIINLEKSKEFNRTVGYTLEQINKLRDHFGTRPKRTKDDPCLTVAIQSFKGGVSKSVTAVHFSQYLAQKGYRVLLIDCDPQASATSSFGFLPDKAFQEKDTLIPYLENKHQDLQYCILKTYFPGVDLIPSCLPFYEAEFKLAFAAAAANDADERLHYFHEFKSGIDTIKDQYDFVIIDSPPALGMITINILVGADAIVVPTCTSLYDFSSTVQYFRMIREVMSKIAVNKQYDFIKILATRVDTRKPIHVEFMNLMKKIFGDSMFDKAFLQTAEVENCASKYQTIYDMKKPQKRALTILDNVFTEIELSLLKSWKSKSTQLIEEGVI
jgi:chromosome partitioning protein